MNYVESVKTLGPQNPIGSKEHHMTTSASPSRGAASLAASLASILTRYAVQAETISGSRPSNASSVEKALASFASTMASIAASPASEFERLTASMAASMSSVLASFAKSLGSMK